MKLKIFTLCLALVASVGTTTAEIIERVKIGDLYYNLYTQDHTAEVTYKSYEGGGFYNSWWAIATANIPSSVEYNAETYSVTGIAANAFYGCTDLTSVTIPNSVEWIDEYAFYYCRGLTSVTIPNSVTYIGDKAFEDVINIVYLGSATGSPWGAKCINGYVDGDLVYRDNTKTYLLGCSSAATGEIIIPNSVTSIGDEAFQSCRDLTSVIIPNSVTSIGDKAFQSCWSLTSMTIPNSVTSIGDKAFQSCWRLTSMTIPNSVTSIGESAFEYCDSLKSITIPSSVTSIGDYAFCNSGLEEIIVMPATTKIEVQMNAFYWCDHVKKVTCHSTTPPILTPDYDASIFESEYKEKLANVTLYVPQSAMATYKEKAVFRAMNIQPIGSEGAETTELKTVPSDNSVEIVWPSVAGAATYEMIIKDAKGNVVCTLIFGSDGQLKSITFAAPARDGANKSQQASGFAFTVTGLESGTTYNLTMTAKDSNGKTLQTKTISFTTTGTITPPQPESNAITVRLDPTSATQWNKVYLYAWIGSGDDATILCGYWPGTQVSK
ncbi:MAG: leucine-rich repeat domain-containing protein, partial [Paludibacteraceae bacterium]|nr:leucine-rich repeat domain-containing protein [Paludibacteraceae bacterium]